MHKRTTERQAGSNKNETMASKRRITIQQASDELADLGYELRPQPVKQDFVAKKTWYAVVATNGNVRAMTAAEIAAFIEQQKQA